MARFKIGHGVRRLTCWLLVGMPVMVATLGCSPASCSSGNRRAAVWEEVRQGQQRFNENDVATALPHLQAAMSGAKATADEEAYFEAAVYMAMVYHMAGQNERGYELLRNLHFIETTNKQAYASQYYYRLMALYAAKLDKDYERALKLTRQGIQLSQRLYPHDTAFVYMDTANMGETFLLAGKPNEAWAIVRQLEQSPPVSYELYLSEVYYLHATLACDSGHYDEAYHYATLGLDYSQKYDAPENELLNLGVMCRVDSLRNQLTSYIKHQQTLNQRRDQFQGSKMAYLLATLQGEGELAQMKAEHERGQLVFLLLTAMLVVTVAALSAIIVISRRNAQARYRMSELQQQQLNAQLERQRLEKELMELKMQQSAAQLDKAYKDNVSMSVRLVERSNKSNADEQRRALEETLIGQHADFIGCIRQQFPHLTDNDIRLMGFIRMGIKPQVIASALNISPASQNTARYRLRKKLGLQPDEDLKQFVDAL